MNSDNNFQGVGEGMKYPSEYNASKNKIAKRKFCMETELSTGDPGTGSASGTDATFPYLSKGGSFCSHTEICHRVNGTR